MKRERDNGFGEWGGYMEAKMSKLEHQFSEEASNMGLKEDDLFKGISIFVNGYTVPPAYELRNLMMKHGGSFHHYHRPDKTTYIVASNLPDSKLKQVNRLTIIKPEWIIDSIKAGKLLNHQDYLLYSNQSITQPVLQFNKKLDVRSPTKTAKDDKFLSEFYNNSRLHLISTMGATFKQYVNELRTKITDFPGKDSLINRARGVDEGVDQYKVSGWGTVIMHVDMDCFFVSVNIRQRPDLIGKPVAVTHSKGNKPSHRPGVDVQAEYKAYHGNISSNPNHWSNNAGQSYSMSEVASCSYEARKAGVKNGMFMGQALTLCPNLVTLPYDFEGYKEVAKVLYDTIARYTLNIEAVSCDEMFVDCTELLATTLITPLEFASIIRNEIKEKTGCPCSTGFGCNKLQARLATCKAKPNGQFFLEPDMVLDFMSSIPVSDLPGVGRSTTYKLKTMGITTCSELQKLSLSMLKTEFGGKFAETLYNYAYGRDSKSLKFEKVRKSVSAEVNYGIRFQEDSERDKFLKQLSEEVSKRLDEVALKGKSITLKIMVKSKDAPEETAKFLGHGVCDYFTKTNTLRSHTDDPGIIFREVKSIISQFNIPCKDLRGIGIQMSKLISQQCAKNNLSKFFKSNPMTDKVDAAKVNITDQDDSNKKEKLLNAEKYHLSDGQINSKVGSINVFDFNELQVSEKLHSNLEPDNNIEKDQLGPSRSSTIKSGPSKSVTKKNNLKMKDSRIKTNNIQPDLHDISISQIDPSFLEALPNELKSEILDAVKKKPVLEPRVNENVLKNVQNHFNGVDNSNFFSKNEDKDKINGNSLWGKVKPVEMRRLIKDWVGSNVSPQACDVAMFTHYLTSLVSSRQIDELFILLEIFSWQLKKTSILPEWTESYKAILEEVQNKMLDVYGAKLIQIS